MSVFIHFQAADFKEREVYPVRRRYSAAARNDRSIFGCEAIK
jgi:hypothetical protein